ncbi:M20 metallopeptidase family protein [Inediibacterium massiliense]|uniref:M20 metallopeptidase family protein n=1 Tax=Inediibacterium massiliense TaxID=1658111 RepID=UPI0006B552C7|nr:amidohydrolase [Inediibacterium massiliense]
MDKIKEEIHKIYEEVVAWRRDFHMHPELSGEEERTSQKIEDILKKLPLEIQTGVGGYGVVGLLRGKEKGSTIALRADIDALPIHEQNDHKYASKYNGKMHACGHDGHTAILLGAAHVLCALKDEIKGNVKFIFQPSEEKAPIGGAKPMIEEGVLDHPKVDAIVGLHIWPNLSKGKIAIKENAIMASSDPFQIEIFGKSGHASAPDESIDALAVACQVVNMLQYIVSRNTSPLESAVVTVGTLKSGTKYNVISDYALLEGTVRTLHPNVQMNVEKRIKEVVEGVCSSMGARGEVHYERGYPALINDKDMVHLIEEVGQKLLSKENVIQVQKPAMGGEDFANYVQKVPGAFFWLGAKEESLYPIHNPKFDFDEEIMKIGMEIFVHTVLDFLGKEKKNE